MATKDESEVERIRQMGKITTSVVGEVADFLTSHKTDHDLLLSKDDQPLTIGDVKRQINLWLAERGSENPEGTIFAIGRDAGVLTAAVTRRIGSIRTDDCLISFRVKPVVVIIMISPYLVSGYASDEAQTLRHVHEVYLQIMSNACGCTLNLTKKGL
jgi:hypothetical protein